MNATHTIRVEVGAIIHVVQARLDADPSDARDWTVIAQQLEQAARKARKAAKAQP